MDLILARLAGSTPPTREELLEGVRRQDWLTHRPDDPLAVGGTFVFPGGGLYVVCAPVSEGPYVAPWLYVWLGHAQSFPWVAPRILRLASQLGLGLEPTFPAGGWWEPPSQQVHDEYAERAIAVASACYEPEAWFLLNFVLSAPSCLQLAQSNPALALLAACFNWFENRPGTSTAEKRAFFRELTGRPRPEILAAMNSCPSRSMVRLLGKVAPEHIDIQSLRLLTQAELPRNAERALAHLPRFRCGTISLVADPELWPHVGTQLLREAAEDPDEDAVSILLRDTLEMARRVHEQVGVVPSHARLVALHDDLLRRWNAMPREEEGADQSGDSYRQRAAAAPPPPNGTDAIQPLRTAAELREEGEVMQHCVGSYDGKVLRGECHVYRVLEPERATLALRWQSSRRQWEIAQLRGTGNRAVGFETRRAIRDWLDGARGSPR
jgi:hypothetical protein